MSKVYIKAALITIALASIGVFFINQLDQMRANELKDQIESISTTYDTERALFLYSQIMGNASVELCSYAESTEKIRSLDTYNLFHKINYYEKSNILNSDYEKIKNKYYLSNALLYLNLRAQAKYCGKSNYTPILFFYRIKKECPECRAQGGVLDKLRNSHPEIRVFAFPIDSGQLYVDMFVNRHKIKEVPSIVIDDSLVISGLHSEEDLERYLAESKKAAKT